MAKTKADLQADRDAYRTHLAAAAAAMDAGLFAGVVRHALAALPFVDGMMAYGQKYEDAAFRSVAAIDHILRYAPLLLDRRPLGVLAGVLRQQKRIDRLAADDLAARLAEAGREIGLNYRLWTHLDARGHARQDELRQTLGGEQDYWRWACEAWEKMGLLRRVPSRNSYVVSLATRIGEVVRAKCSACGVPQDAPKAMFFEDVACPACGRTASFVILAA